MNDEDALTITRTVFYGDRFARTPREIDEAFEHITARLRGEAAPAPVAGDAMTTPATPLTLRGLIAYGRVAAMPWQGAKPDHMRDLIGQMVPHLLQLEAVLAQDRAAQEVSRD